MDERHLSFIPRDDIWLYNTGHARKAWLCYGCRWIPELGEYRFVVWAPNAQAVSLTGDFNAWGDQPMERMEGGASPIATRKLRRRRPKHFESNLKT